MNLKHLSHLRAPLLFAAMSLLSRPAQADTLVGALPVTAVPGSIGNQFDIFLTNDGPGSITVSGFTFEISVANPFISFTDATTSTVLPYIFDANSAFGPDLTGPATGQSLATSDLYAIPLAGATIGAGSTAGLGRVSFDVLAGATPGTFLVNFSAFPSTSLSDPNALDIPITALTSGTITIAGETSVPEPSTAALVLGVLLLASRRLRQSG
jgi:hypothetical protein